jgi:hypothetical protein
MGLYAGLRPLNPTWAQVPAAMLKVPLLFLLTLAVTLPSLYVFSALAQSRLRFPETLRLLLTAVVVDLAMLASLGPVTAFFTLSTESYPFIVFLNVCFFAPAGIVGVAFLARALRDVFAHGPAREMSGEAAETSGAAPAKTIRSGPRHQDRSSFVLRVWILIYALVGMQMGWILRPFISNPVDPWTPFRPRRSNVFEAFVQMVRELFG